jgi:hypothetical protein
MAESAGLCASERPDIDKLDFVKENIILESGIKRPGLLARALKLFAFSFKTFCGCKQTKRKDV